MAGKVDHDALVEERGAEYGESWQLTDQWIKENAELLANAPSPFPLIMIHNKLMRTLTSPSKQDHYDDICGYAKLALRALELQKEQPVNHWLVQNELDEIARQREGADMIKILEYLHVLAVGAKLIAAILQDDAAADREAVKATIAMLARANDVLDPKATVVDGLQRLLVVARRET